MELRPGPGVPVPRALAVLGAWGWRIVIGVGAIVLILWATLQLSVIVVPLLLSLFVVAALEPAVRWLRDRGWPSWAATLALLLLVTLALVGLGAWFGTRLAGQFGELAEELRQAARELERWLVSGPLGLSQERVAELRSQLTSVGGGDALLSRLAGRARQVSEVLGAVALFVVYTFFLLKDGRAIGRWLTDRLPARFRDDAGTVGGRVGHVLRRYLLGTAVVGLVDAVLLGLALVVLGVPLVLPLAILTFFGAFLPLVGAFVSGGLAALVGLVAGGFQTALLVILAAVIVQQIEGNVAQPVIVGEAVSLHPIVTISAVSAGLLLGGVLGGFLAVPLVAVAVQVVEHFGGRDDGGGDGTDGTDAAEAPLVRVELVDGAVART